MHPNTDKYTEENEQRKSSRNISPNYNNLKLMFKSISSNDNIERRKKLQSIEVNKKLKNSKNLSEKESKEQKDSQRNASYQIRKLSEESLKLSYPASLQAIAGNHSSRVVNTGMLASNTANAVKEDSNDVLSNSQNERYQEMFDFQQNQQYLSQQVLRTINSANRSVMNQKSIIASESGFPQVLFETSLEAIEQAIAKSNTNKSVKSTNRSRQRSQIVESQHDYGTQRSHRSSRSDRRSQRRSHRGNEIKEEEKVDNTNAITQKFFSQNYKIPLQLNKKMTKESSGTSEQFEQMRENMQPVISIEGLSGLQNNLARKTYQDVEEIKEQQVLKLPKDLIMKRRQSRFKRQVTSQSRGLGTKQRRKSRRSGIPANSVEDFLLERENGLNKADIFDGEVQPKQHHQKIELLNNMKSSQDNKHKSDELKRQGTGTSNISVDRRSSVGFNQISDKFGRKETMFKRNGDPGTDSDNDSSVSSCSDSNDSDSYNDDSDECSSDEEIEILGFEKNPQQLKHMHKNHAEKENDLKSQTTIQSSGNRMNMYMRALSYTRRLKQKPGLNKMQSRELDVQIMKNFDQQIEKQDTSQTAERIKIAHIHKELSSSDIQEKDRKVNETEENLILLGLRAPSTLESGRKNCMFYPNDTIKVFFWDIIQSIILLITCILTPINMAFGESLELIIGYQVFSYTVDILFFLDIIVNFNSAFVNNLNELEDDRKLIAFEYFRTWFFVDSLAIIPFELIMKYASTVNEDDTGVDSSDNYNQYVRIMRVSKLYKLVKLTRLIRLIKLGKAKKQIANKFNNLMKKEGQGTERLCFFILALFLMCHLIACIWIFVAQTFNDPDEENDTWIESGGYTENSNMQLYVVSCYFTMQTLTTVGYGDINIVSIPERVFCMLLQLIGIICFSFASGSLTTLIAHMDQCSFENQEQVDILNKIFKDYHLPPDLYFQLMTQIENDDQKHTTEQMEFLDDLPFRLKIRTIMYLYKEHYIHVNFLKNQSESFLGWICPQMNQIFIPVDQYIFYETDLITEIYFLTMGNAGFVLPFKQNIVYIEINNGSYFGEIDCFVASGEHLMTCEEMFENIQAKNFNLVRQFTIQAIDDCQMLSLSIKNLQRMQKQFNAQFKRLFRNGERGLAKALNLKFEAIMKADDSSLIINVEKFRKKKLKSNFYKKMSKADVQIFTQMETDDEVRNLRFYKGCKNLKQVMHQCDGHISSKSSDSCDEASHDNQLEDECLSPQQQENINNVKENADLKPNGVNPNLKSRKNQNFGPFNLPSDLQHQLSGQSSEVKKDISLAINTLSAQKENPGMNISSTLEQHLKQTMAMQTQKQLQKMNKVKMLQAQKTQQQSAEKIETEKKAKKLWAVLAKKKENKKVEKERKQSMIVSQPLKFGQQNNLINNTSNLSQVSNYSNSEEVDKGSSPSMSRGLTFQQGNDPNILENFDQNQSHGSTNSGRAPGNKPYIKSTLNDDIIIEESTSSQPSSQTQSGTALQLTPRRTDGNNLAVPTLKLHRESENVGATENDPMFQRSQSRLEKIEEENDQDNCSKSSIRSKSKKNGSSFQDMKTPQSSIVSSHSSISSASKMSKRNVIKEEKAVGDEKAPSQYSKRSHGDKIKEIIDQYESSQIVATKDEKTNQPIYIIYVNNFKDKQDKQ